MHRHLSAALASLLALTAAVTAQNCSDNTYPLRLVDVTGTPLPTSGTGSSAESLADGEQVYAAFDANLPSGLYYVHVTDEIGGHDEVLSMNQPADRFVQVDNAAGVITLTRPFSIDPDAPAFGSGINGVGDSLPLFPFLSPSWDPCRFKAWLGNSWSEPINPTNPYLLRGGYDADLGVCRVRSYTRFRLGDGTGSDVTGKVFADGDRDGLQGPAEGGIGGTEVRLVGVGDTVTAITDTDGSFRFVDVAAGDYSVEVTVAAGTTATTPTSLDITVCGCADVAVEAFGCATECMRSCGHTIGYWRNRHGLGLISRHNLLPQLNGLCPVNRCGRHLSFRNTSDFACWLRGASSWNMAYMLSAQMSAMYLNVAVGFVDPGAVIDDPNLGQMAIGDLLAQAAASVCAHPYTPPGSPRRALQEHLKSALDEANNNRNWVNACGDCGNDGGGRCDSRPRCPRLRCPPPRHRQGRCR